MSDNKNQRRSAPAGAVASSETAAVTTTAVATTRGPSAAMLALFSKESTVDETKVVRRNMPPLLKPTDVPIWTPENPMILQGTIIDVIPSPTSTVKGRLLWIKLPTGQEITFPCTGVVRNALAPGIKDEDKKLDESLKKEIGKTIYLKRLPGRPSKFKNDMFMFDVYTSK